MVWQKIGVQVYTVYHVDSSKYLRAVIGPMQCALSGLEVWGGGTHKALFVAQNIYCQTGFFLFF